MRRGRWSRLVSRPGGGNAGCVLGDPGCAAPRSAARCDRGSIARSSSGRSTSGSRSTSPGPASPRRRSSRRLGWCRTSNRPAQFRHCSIRESQILDPNGHVGAHPSLCEISSDLTRKVLRHPLGGRLTGVCRERRDVDTDAARRKSAACERAGRRGDSGKRDRAERRNDDLAHQFGLRHDRTFEKRTGQAPQLMDIDLARDVSEFRSSHKGRLPAKR